MSLCQTISDGTRAPAPDCQGTVRRGRKTGPAGIRARARRAARSPSSVCVGGSRTSTMPTSGRCSTSASSSSGALATAAAISKPCAESSRINHRAPPLLWLQVRDDLQAEMDSGELAVDARLPGELELAEQYGVSRDTIRRAIQELVSQGRLVVLHGRGPFVTKPAQ